MPDGTDYAVIWRPQPGPQTALLTCPIFEVLYGGARGGGKTDGALGDWVAHADRHGDAASGLMVRRKRTELIDTIERSHQIFGPLGATFHAQDKLWRMPNGARLLFAYLENDSDAEAYQGHSYTRVYVEEAGNFPSEKPIAKLRATLRSRSGVRVGMRLTANPGGPGHQWVKARYIDPAPAGYQILRDENGLERVFIPARVGDNKILMANDPDYVARLKSSGSPELVRAWLEGDWNVIAGAYFPEFGPQHIVRPFEIPKAWMRFRAMDWGSARPFSIGWYAVSDGSLPAFPRGALIRYREWYGWNGKPNEGCRMVAEDVGAGISERERLPDGGYEEIRYGVIDPAARAEDGGPALTERIYNGSGRRVGFGAADNKRVARNGAMGGWDQLRARLQGEDGRPMLYFFDTCVHAIRTVPALQHDEKNPEDVDSEGEDHAPDEIRYACMSRPYVPAPKTEPTKTDFWIGIGSGERMQSNLSIREMIERQTRRRKEAGR